MSYCQISDRALIMLIQPREDLAENSGLQVHFDRWSGYKQPIQPTTSNRIVSVIGFQQIVKRGTLRAAQLLHRLSSFILNDHVLNQISRTLVA